MGDKYDLKATMEAGALVRGLTLLKITAESVAALIVKPEIHVRLGELLFSHSEGCLL